MSSRLILWNLKISGETMFSLIDVMLGWFLNFWIAISTGSSKPSHSLTNSLSHWMFGELTAVLYNLSNFWAISLLADIISSSLTRVILEDLGTLWLRNDLIVFQSFLLSVTSFMSNLSRYFFLSFLSLLQKFFCFLNFLMLNLLSILFLIQIFSWLLSHMP